MKENQLKLLEERISKAVEFIETLKSREKNLIREKVKLGEKVSILEKELEGKEDKIKELKGSQEFLKEKIETILGKLESFASIDVTDKYESTEETEEDKIERSNENEPESEMIIEDEIVDLKENVREKETVDMNRENEESSDEQKDETSSISEVQKTEEIDVESDLESEPVPEKDSNSLFNTDENLFKKASNADPNESVLEGSNTKWFDNNPFIET